MPLKLTKKQPVAEETVSMHAAKTEEPISESSKALAIEVPPEIASGVTEHGSAQMCEVTVKAGYTHNLKNYQSARVDIGVMIPCTHEELPAVYTYAVEWVDSRLQVRINELVAQTPD